MKLAVFSFIYFILFAEKILPQEKSLLEIIGIIVGIVVGIATIAGIIISYLAYQRSKKKKDDKQQKEQEIILAGGSVATGKSKVVHEEAGGDILKAGRDIIIQKSPEEKEELAFPLAAGLHNQTPPEVHFVGREGMLDTITGWYKSSDVRVGALIGWGGVGKSALARKWYDSLEANGIRPDGIFWWGFYRNAFLEQFLNALLRYVSGGQIDADAIKSTWEKTERIKEYIHKGRFLIVLDGLEQMQKGESGDEFGKMLNPELTELLHYLADGPKEERLCLITTRYRMKDLDDWDSRGYEKLPLIELSESDALLMLKNRGIEGDDDKIKEVIKRYKGHALSLTLLGGYLKKHHNRDIKKAPGVKFVLNDKKRFKDVNKLLEKYVGKMSEAERVFLNIFSLFRGDVTEDDFTGVFRHKIEDAKFNNVLVKMSELDFKDLKDGLADWRLIAYDETKETYSTHPLIKGYFEADFAEKKKKLCHKRIYQYFGENAPEKPETLEQMQPLFEQVYHGCAAGFYQKTLDEVFYPKINRSGEHFLYHKLGAWETELALVKTFFPKGDLSHKPLVSEKAAQSFLLNEAGLALLSIGKPKEAEELFVRKINREIEYKDLKNVSVGYRNLAELQFRTGEIESGLESAKKALDAAEKAKSDRYAWASKGYLGWILFLLGRSKEAQKQLSLSNELERKISGNQLYSDTGIKYADFLSSMKRIDEAFELTIQNLDICKNQKWSNSISRCHRCLGAIERIKGNFKEAEGHLQKALEISREIGVPELEIEAMLEYGRLHLDTEKYEDAIQEASDVLKICGRTGFKLYEPGAEIILAKAYLALKDTKQAESFAHSAYEKATSMKYRWPEGEAGHLLGEVYIAEGDKVKARKWLEKAVACRKEISDPNVEESKKMLKKLG